MDRLGAGRGNFFEGTGPSRPRPGGSRDPRSPLSVRELWVRLPVASSVDLQLGRFELGWGKTDGYSPADAFLPRDLSDPFADEKLPLWASRLSGQKGPLRMEAVVGLITTLGRLPVLGGRNVPLRTDSPFGRIEYDDIGNAPPEIGIRRPADSRDDRRLGRGELGKVRGPACAPPHVPYGPGDPRSVGPDPTCRTPLCPGARGRSGGLTRGGLMGATGRGGRPVFRGFWPGGRSHRDAESQRGIGDGTMLVTSAGNAKDTPVDPALLFDRALLPALIAAWNRTEEWGSWKVVWTEGLKYGDGLLKAEVGYNATDLWRMTLGGDTSLRIPERRPRCAP